MNTIQDLVPSLSLENLLAQRDAIVERLRKAAELIDEVERLSQAAFENDDAAPSLECRRSHAYFPGQVDELVKRVDATAWNFLMERSGLRSFMDAKAREQWKNDIQERKVAPLTWENIQATFRELFAARQEMFERGVLEVFRRLSWDYKTNNPRFFGRRIIVRGVVYSWGKRGICGPESSGCDRIDDLVRVMTVLDGRPEPDHRQGAFSALVKVYINGSQPTGPVVLSEVVSLRCYANGNAHITFLRPELVEKMNAILARHHPRALPPA